MKNEYSLPSIAQPLLNWYHANRRVLPFRETPTPYRIWVSEIMLQQTRMTAVLPYYERFMAALPDVPSLANCSEDQLHKLWEGLGYYNRARNMQKAAKIVTEEYNGQLPADYEKLLALPGIGSYTAGAIASIAYGLPQVAVDGNVLRVASRLMAFPQIVEEPKAKKFLTEEIAKNQPADQAGDYNQALMELGALVCTPGLPHCDSCPLQNLCQGLKLGVAAELPNKKPKKAKVEMPICLLVIQCGNKVLLHQRPKKGLLAGLWEPFLLEGKFTKEEAARELAKVFPQAVLEAKLPKSSHIFTHKIWRMYGWAGRVENTLLPDNSYVFASPEDLAHSYAIPAAFHSTLKFMEIIQ